jgi:hypothetical protein
LLESILLGILAWKELCLDKGLLLSEGTYIDLFLDKDLFELAEFCLERLRVTSCRWKLL